MLTLKLFGAPGIEQHGAPVTGRAAQGRRLALLVLLAMSRSRTVTRDKIIALLWPETPGDRARQRLSDDLYILRGALGESVLQAFGDDLALDREQIGCDVWDFERLLDARETADAVPLYHGPLLDGFHVPETVEFEQWLDAERGRLAQRFAAALETLAEASEVQSDFATAAGWWQRLAALDPGNGRVAVRLMRALDAAGERAGALRHARIHAAFLRDEFEAQPDPQVSAFADRLRLEPPPRTVADAWAVVGPGAATSVAPSDGVVAESPGATSPSVTRRSTLLRWTAVAAIVVTVASIGFTSLTAKTPAVPVAASVGVLPFVNIGGDPQDQYFGDGLAEQIITALGGVGGLRVSARTSSFALRDRKLDARAIGDTLGVAAVLEGSVRRSSDRLRITAQLVDAATGYSLWTGEYDRDLREVLTVQDQIASAIASALKLRLAPGGSSASLPPAMDLRAYDLYLRALYLRNSLAPASLQRAEAILDSVIAREPRFALAYAVQASIIAPQLYFGRISLREGLPKLRAMTSRALELDPSLGEAYATLGMVKMFFDWDWSGAEQALRRAIQLNPSDAHAHHHLANYLSATLRHSEALAARERAFSLDPLNARSAYLLASDYVASGKNEDALRLYRTALALDPAHTFLLGSGPLLPLSPADVYLAQGRTQEAVDELVRIATLRRATEAEVSALRRGFAESGMHGFWRRWIDMETRQANGAMNAVLMAKLWILAGDATRALEQLEHAYDERNPAMIYLRSDRTMQLLREEPRYLRMADGMKFPASQAAILRQ